MKINLTFAVLLFIVMLVFRWMIAFSPSSDIAGIESNVIYTIIRYMQTGTLYADPAGLPFSITQYSPIFYYFCAGLAKLLHINPSADVHALYVMGRLVNIVVNLFSAWGIFRIARQSFRLPQSYSLMAALASFLLLYPWNFAARQDSLQDLFAIWTTYAFLTFLLAGKGNRVLPFIASAVLAVLAVYAKQNGIQMVILICVFLAANGQWRSFLGFAALSGTLLIGSVLVYKQFNPYFLDNVVGGVQNGIDLSDYSKYILHRRPFLFQVLPFAIASVVICLRRLQVFKGPLAVRFLCYAVAGTFLFAAVTAMKKGSTTQYFVVFSSLAGVLIARAIYELAQQEKFKKLPLAGFGTINIMLLAFAVHTYRTCLSDSQVSAFRQKEDAVYRVIDYFEKKLPVKSGEYVFANLSTDYIIPPRGNFNNVLARMCVVPQLDILAYSTGPVNVFGYTRFARYLNDGTIRYIVESSPQNPFRITPEFDSIRNTRFKKVAQVGPYTIYQFKAAAL